jgi:hypothetical protein
MRLPVVRAIHDIAHNAQLSIWAKSDRGWTATRVARDVGEPSRVQRNKDTIVGVDIKFHYRINHTVGLYSGT